MKTIWPTVGLCVLSAAVLVGCTSAASDPAATSAAPSSARPVPITTSNAPLAVDSGPTLRFKSAAGGVVLPDPTLTPGALVAKVTKATVCGKHPLVAPHHPSVKTKTLVLSDYGIPIPSRHNYEVDNLIPPELGGSNLQANLWPQPRENPGGLPEKVQLEAKLRGLVCAGSVPLATAQKVFTTNWWAGYLKYVGPPPKPKTTAPAHPTSLLPPSPTGPVKTTSSSKAPGPPKPSVSVKPSVVSPSVSVKPSVVTTGPA